MDPRFGAALELLVSRFQIPQQPWREIGATSLVEGTAPLVVDGIRRSRPPLARYVAEVQAIAHRFGLHRIRRMGRMTGEMAIHEWAQQRATNPGAIGQFSSHWATASFSREPIGELVVDVADGSIDRRPRPRIHVEASLAWDVETERPADIRERILLEIGGQVDLEISRIVERAEAIGFHWPGRRPAPAIIERNLDWTYARLTGASVAEIARAAFLNGDTVRKAVAQMAAALDLETTDWQP